MNNGNGGTTRPPDARRTPRPARAALITGGAGFVGTNLAKRLLENGRRVVVLDNLSRPGVETNLRWLRDRYGARLRVEVTDVRDRLAVRNAVAQAGEVYHFAAQVAVTTSLLDPLHDFEVNARGTLNVLSAINSLNDPPPLLFTSTNKVYGALDDVAVRANGTRYAPTDSELRAHGIGEARPLDFHSPYGCSKGAADQYVLDYARTFGIPAAVFRMSCIYGPHQFGTEDQGWVAHFLIRALRGEPVTIFGDGKQVRDVLFVEDLVDAMLVAQERMADVSGRAFNIGGGPANTTSLVEVIASIEELVRQPARVLLDEWRPGDQRYYVSDCRRFTEATGWTPRTTLHEGLERLHRWLLGAAVSERRQRGRGASVSAAAGGMAAAAGGGR